MVAEHQASIEKAEQQAQSAMEELRAELEAARADALLSASEEHA